MTAALEARTAIWFCSRFFIVLVKNNRIAEVAHLNSKTHPDPFKTRDACGRWHRSCEVRGDWTHTTTNPKGQNVYFLLCTKQKPKQ